MCVCVRVCVCTRACVRVCVRVCTQLSLIPHFVHISLHLSGKVCYQITVCLPVHLSEHTHLTVLCLTYCSIAQMTVNCGNVINELLEETSEATGGVVL